MASGYKRNSKGQFNGGYGRGALGGKGAYAGRKQSAAGARPSGKQGQKMSTRAKKAGKRLNQIKAVKRAAKKTAILSSAVAVGGLYGTALAKSPGITLGATVLAVKTVHRIDRATVRNPTGAKRPGATRLR